MGAGRHGSRSPCGLFSLLLAAAGTPSPVFRRRNSAPFVRPYRPGASREFPALRPAPTGSPDMIPCRRCCRGGGAPNPDDAGGGKQKRDRRSDGEDKGERGDAGQRQQEVSGNPRKEDNTEEQEDAERQEQESNAKGNGHSEEQEPEGRGNVRKEEDRESRCDEEQPRVRLGEGREEPHSRKSYHVLGGMLLHKVRSYFLTRTPIGVKGEGEKMKGRSGELTL
ncbi:hypothetical protein NDU88_005458 [Pleurodeles waltl]|uniref:Uncharacterized protein n=1 Tax=Pleurodeles waltl TaxID=8319 RepID=A0AAV7WCS3_PLEWA|nr:hypothetical protein NDU88_005458 [Pleurodeles waltl]